VYAQFAIYAGIGFAPATFLSRATSLSAFFAHNPDRCKRSFLFDLNEVERCPGLRAGLEL
jgi:hypothetical protein